MANPFVHVELSTDDVDAAKKFYRSLFDWKLEDATAMQYTMVRVGKGTGGGMMMKHMPNQPTAWLPYAEVADVNATLQKARAGGAQVVVERTEIGAGMGAFGVIVDPQGAALGLWEAAKKAPARRAARKKTARKAAKKKPAAKKAKKGKR